MAELADLGQWTTLLDDERDHLISSISPWINLLSKYYLGSDSQQQITVLGCYSAESQSLPLTIIYPGVRSTWTPRQDFQQAHCALSPSGWINSVINEYFKEIRQQLGHDPNTKTSTIFSIWVQRPPLAKMCVFFPIFCFVFALGFVFCFFYKLVLVCVSIKSV